METFDLGRVIQTAETIKGMKRQSRLDQLREQALQGNIAQSEQAMKIASAQEERAGTQFTQEQQITNTKLLNAASAELAQDPSTIERWGPTLEKAGVISPAWRQTPPEQIQALAKQAHASTSEALKALKGPVTRMETVQTADGGILQRNPETGEIKQVVKPDGKPGSYDEFVLAQKDPAFANFLKQRKGKGLSVTMPDGTVIEMGGDGGKVDAGELSKPTINNLQETIVNSTNRLDRLNATLSTYRPEFLQAKGIVNANTTKIKDFIGMDVSPEQKKYLDEYSQFQSSAATDLAQFLKEMSGAAVTPQEYARTEKALPSGTELSPTEFEAKAKVAVKTITRAIMRGNWALKNGIGVKSVEQLSKVMPLESIDKVYEQRANEIWQELGGKPESKAKAIQQANQEFGLAR